MLKSSLIIEESYKHGSVNGNRNIKVNLVDNSRNFRKKTKNKNIRFHSRRKKLRTKITNVLKVVKRIL